MAYEQHEMPNGGWYITEDSATMMRSLFIRQLGMNPAEIKTRLSQENAQPGPYSWDLVCKIAQFEKRLLTHLESFGGISANDKVCAEVYDHWFNEGHGEVGSLIRKEKMLGVAPPHKEQPKPKGFWESLFG